ncbi:MAG: CAP domain-containing protein [Candidatus Wildermuthbacteria bacterium]|nr:CAP domain-containing protein [Candidatus Wildermuthbacteria bacterium]
MKKIIILSIFLLALASSFYFFERTPQFQSIKDENFDIPSAEELFKELEKIVSAPPPLLGPTDTPSSLLTTQGVFEWTNVQRFNFGFQQLSANESLKLAAAAKVQDMFDRQYFAHISPIGQSAGDLATLAGYEYITIGENLALGNFENDEKLVDAWMNSPGHRANILNSKYQEIGVAVGKGIFEGNTRWLAVQIFGKPLSSCPQPSAVLKAQTEEFENSLELLQQNIVALRGELEDMKPKRGEEYNQKVDEYNNLVSQYNTLIEETKKLVAIYNQQVQAFNACLAQ